MTEIFIGSLQNLVERVQPLNYQYNQLKDQARNMKPEQVIKTVEEQVGIRRYQVRMVRGVLR